MGPTLLNQLDKDGTMSILGVSSMLPSPSCRASRSYWSPNGQYVAYAMGEPGGTCADDVNQPDIAIVSLAKGQASRMAEALAGDKHPIGWMLIIEED
jgi:Tol biopolymer transport system component